MTHLIEVINFIEAFEHRRTFRAPQPMKADVVVSSLHVSGFETLRQHALEKGNVFLHQLFLEILGAGGDDDATAPAECGGNRRNKISERLASARSRFNDQMLTTFERTHHRPRHFNLAGTMLVFRMSLGD